MSRVENDRQAQQAEAARRAQKQDRVKSADSRDKFNKAMTQKKNETGEAGREQKTAQGEKASRGMAQNALMARQGISQNAKFAGLMNQQGNKNLQQNQSETKMRGDDMKETRTEQSEELNKVSKEEIDAKSDKLAKIDGEQGGGGGAMGGSSGGADSDGSPKQGQGGPEGIGAGAAHEAAPAQQAGGANAPKLPPEVVQELVKRILVGVGEEGMGTFHIQLKPGVLGGAGIQINADGRKITATFLTNDKNIGRLIKSCEGQLSRALGHKGMSLERLDVAPR